MIAASPIPEGPAGLRYSLLKKLYELVYRKESSMTLREVAGFRATLFFGIFCLSYGKKPIMLSKHSRCNAEQRYEYSGTEN